MCRLHWMARCCPLVVSFCLHLFLGPPALFQNLAGAFDGAARCLYHSCFSKRASDAQPKRAPLYPPLFDGGFSSH